MRDIPIWHWAVAFVAQRLRPGIPETPRTQASPPVSDTPVSTESPEIALDQVASTYRVKIATFQQQRDWAKLQRGTCYGYLTLSLLVLAGSFYLTFGIHLFPLWVVFLPGIAALVAYGEARKRDRRARDSDRLLDLYQRGLQRVKHEWMGKGDPGLDLEMANHLSAQDLDLFGEGSLFELLCEVQTPAGRDALAQWLQTPASPEEVISRQHAVRSLRDRIDLRERLALLRDDRASEYSWNSLRNWPTGSPVHFPRLTPWLALLLSLSLAGMAACGWFGVIEPVDALRMMALIGILEGSLAFSLRSRVLLVLENLRLPARRLESLRQMCLLLERERPESPWLLQMQQKLQGSAKQIAGLQYLVRMRELRDNEYFFWLLFPLLWNTQWTMRIERWRQTHGHELLQYLLVLGEFEALMSIAVHAYENPADPFPELLGEGPRFEAIGMGHPLMDVRTCVRNDLTLGGEKRFFLVTGSNMSGKSTLLRAIGLNATLARMGAPVRAARLRLSPLQVCASTRVDDSLMTGRSHFYAEVERLKAMFDCAASGPSVLYLIDELFGGTNSADRRVAAEAVIRLLVERQAIGLVTSHDLALTEIAEKPELKGANVHFADLPTAEGLSFDYQLRPGKVEHSNALKIIKMMGIPLN